MDYKDLEVWEKSINLVKKIYALCKSFPREELYGLTDQIKRSAISIPANIAEGSGRNTSKEFIRFLYISLGSACELETHLIIANEIGFLVDSDNKVEDDNKSKNVDYYLDKVNEIRKMLNGLINSLKRRGMRNE